jgi:hypothetical protein
MENTFTYTARSASAPEKVVTFTLFDESMSVELGVPLEHLERALAGRGEAEEAKEATEAEPRETQEEDQAPAATSAYYALKPMAVSLMERGGQPFSIADVSATAENGGLDVTAWVRAKGLRLAPVRFDWDRVDNPDGAKAFVREVRARNRVTSRPGRFGGIMDYWISWLAFGALILALFWPRKRGHEPETDQE